MSQSPQRMRNRADQVEGTWALRAHDLRSWADELENALSDLSLERRISADYVDRLAAAELRIAELNRLMPVQTSA